MRLILILVFTLLLPQIVKSQFNHDFDIEPKPYREVEYYGDKVSSGIKKLTQIKTVDTDKGEYNDTVRITTYGQDGRKTSVKSYKKNKVEYYYNYRYKNSSEMVWEEIQGLNTVYRSISTYDKKGNIIAIKNYNLRGNDTLYPNQATFSYKDGKLITREDRFQNLVNGLKGYRWDGDNLVEATIYLKPTDKKYYYRYHYTYSPEGRLTELNLFQQRDTIRYHARYNKFIYSGEYLTEERYTLMGHPKDEIKAVYNYSDAGKLKNIHVSQQDNTYLIIDYEYNKLGQLFKKIIKANTDKVFKQIFLLVPYTTSSVKPYTVEEIYEYDDKSNITSVSRYANNELFWQMVYEIEYY